MDNDVRLEDIRKLSEFMTGIDTLDYMYVKGGINAYLNAGWVLLAIQQRGSYEVGLHTVYVFGTADKERKEPDFDHLTQKWGLPS